MSTSVTAVTCAPDRTCVSLRMWSWPIIPTPMTPTLSVTTISPSPSVRPTAGGTHAAGGEVARSAGRDRQRNVRLDRVEVLLDHAEDVAVELGQRVEERGHGGLAVGRFDHGAPLHRLGQRQLLGQHAVAHHRVDLLE